jgi:AcrR family transcriptional regulator
MEVKNNIKAGIMVKAEELFRRYGMRSVTMDDLANELSISKKTLYRHFNDKDELVIKICKEAFRRLGQDQEDIRKNSKNAIDEIIQLMEYMNVMFGTMRQNVLYDMKKYYPEAWKTYVDYKEQTLKACILQNIKRGIKEDVYRKEIKPEIVASLRIALVETTFDPNAFPQNKFDFAEVQEQSLSMFMYGLLSTKGHKQVEEYFSKQSPNKLKHKR